MPANSLDFRPVCGLFRWTFISFMTKRARFIAMMRARVVLVKSRLQFTLFVFVAHLLLCCGDIEVQPGPSSATDLASGKEKAAMAESDSITQDSLRNMLQKMIDDQAEKILLGTQQQIQAVQSEIAQVNSFVQSLSEDVACIKERASNLEQMCEKSAEERDSLKSSVGEVEEKLEGLTKKFDEKLDRLEAYSRRENLLLFGIPESDKENCVEKVLQTVRTALPDKQWSDDDIVRAHRLGTQAPGPGRHNSRERPMIVRFLRWRDKMKVLTQGREALRQQNIQAAADLTQRQRDNIKAHRDRGQHAYYRGSQLVVSGPLRQRQQRGERRQTEDTEGGAGGIQGPELSDWETVTRQPTTRGSRDYTP